MIDGCGEYSAFWRVPCCRRAKPGLVTVAIFEDLGVWKE